MPSDWDLQQVLRSQHGEGLLPRGEISSVMRMSMRRCGEAKASSAKPKSTRGRIWLECMMLYRLEKNTNI